VFYSSVGSTVENLQIVPLAPQLLIWSTPDDGQQSTTVPTGIYYGNSIQRKVKKNNGE